MHDGAKELFPENVVTDSVTPLTDPNWEEPEDGADDVEDEDELDIDLDDETELEAEEVAERDRRR
jgi:multicomponent Na+:H+ antiporter subunit G